MGWQSEIAPEHEGYAIAVVEENGFWRQVTKRTDGDVEKPVTHFQVECECGWRSPRKLAPAGTVWFPSIVMFVSHAADERTYDLWREHITHVAAGRQ